jgi:hypothetical protein
MQNDQKIYYYGIADFEGGARLLAEIEQHYRDDPQLSLKLSKRISGETFTAIWPKPGQRRERQPSSGLPLRPLRHD